MRAPGLVGRWSSELGRDADALPIPAGAAADDDNDEEDEDDDDDAQEARRAKRKVRSRCPNNNPPR